MEVKASLKYLRISPRKVRLVAKPLKGLSVTEAEAQLRYIHKRSTNHLEKLLHSAVANAKHNFGLEKENLYIANITVNQGPTLIRYMPRARNAAYQIRRRSSHITLILKNVGEAKEKKISQQKAREDINISRGLDKKMKETKKIKEETKKKIPRPVLKEKEMQKPKVVSRTVPKQTIFRRKSI